MRPKKLNEWYALNTDRLTRAEAPVSGTVPSKMRLPSYKEYVKMTALE